MDGIIARCLSLSPAQKRSLVTLLQESLSSTVLRNDEFFNKLYNVAVNMFGCDVFSPSRKFEYVLARRFIAYHLRAKGYTITKIGKLLTLSHSTVTHSLHLMDYMLERPYVHKTEMAYWKTFNELLTEQDNDKS